MTDEFAFLSSLDSCSSYQRLKSASAPSAGEAKVEAQIWVEHARIALCMPNRDPANTLQELAKPAAPLPPPPPP